MPGNRPTHHALQFPCQSPGCLHWFQNSSGRTQHMHACHLVAPTQDLPQLHQPPQFSPPPPDDLPPPQSSPGLAPADEDPNLPETQFTDTSERYFRTYHPLLNGKC